MPEEEKKEETPKPEEKKESDTSQVLTKAEELAKRIEDGNAKTEELVKRQEEIAAKNILGGKSDAGEQATPEKEETPQEYAKRIMGG